MKHFLSVGGTGMLAHATVVLAGKADAATIVARRASRFVREHGLAHAAAIDIDWSDPAYPARIDAALAKPADLALLWSEPGHAFKRLLEGSGRVIVVLGTGAGDHEARIARRRQAARGKRARLLFVALGSKPAATGRRWLTHDEISGGVLECERTSRDLTVGETGRTGRGTDR